jgi:hypothetical protein
VRNGHKLRSNDYKKTTIVVPLRVVGISSSFQELKLAVAEIDLPLFLPNFFRFTVEVEDDEGNDAVGKKRRYS